MGKMTVTDVGNGMSRVYDPDDQSQTFLNRNLPQNQLEERAGQAGEALGHAQAQREINEIKSRVGDPTNYGR